MLLLKFKIYINFCFEKVDALHSSDIDTEDGILPGGTPAGFVVKGNDISFYFSGDTGNFLKSFHLILILIIIIITTNINNY